MSASTSACHVSTITALPPEAKWHRAVGAQANWKKVVDNDYQEFYEHWLKPDGPKFPERGFPYTLSLGSNSLGAPLLPFRRGDMSDEILVTDAYHKTFRRLMSLRQRDMGNKVGAVITHLVRQLTGRSVPQGKPLS